MNMSCLRIKDGKIEPDEEDEVIGMSRVNMTVWKMLQGLAP